MSNECVAPDGDKLTDKGVRLDSSARTDAYATLYFDERPDEAIVANAAVVKICWLNKLYISSE